MKLLLIKSGLILKVVLKSRSEIGPFPSGWRCSLGALFVVAEQLAERRFVYFRYLERAVDHLFVYLH